MPIAFDPDARGVWSLASDRKKPEPRPLFEVRFLTDRQCDRLRDLRDAFDAEMEKLSDEQFWKRYWEVISFGVIGWRNMPWAAAELPENAPLTIENLRVLLTPSELLELARCYHLGVQLDEGDRKNSSTPQSQGSPMAAAATSPPAAT